MLSLNDIEVIECDEEASMEDYYLSLQRAINSGVAWSFQGSYGRAMSEAISAGLCMLGKNRARDYYGNTIPSRDDVEPFTKGSYDFVMEERGQEWADLMENA